MNGRLRTRSLAIVLSGLFLLTILSSMLPVRASAKEVKLSEADSPEEYFWLYCIAQGFSPEKTAGIMANVYAGMYSSIPEKKLEKWDCDDNGILQWLDEGTASVFVDSFGEDASYEDQTEYLISVLWRAEGLEYDEAEPDQFDSAVDASSAVYAAVLCRDFKSEEQAVLTAYAAQKYLDKFEDLTIAPEADEMLLRMQMVDLAYEEVGHRGGDRYTGGSGEAWCTEFVCWCADQLGFCDADVIPDVSYSGALKSWFDERGLWVDADDDYIPQPGDIILYDWEDDDDTDHTGLVVECDGDQVYTIEGNVGDVCREMSVSIDSWKIAGYCVPAYAED